MANEKNEILICSRDIELPKEKTSGKCEFALFIDEKAKWLDLHRRDIAAWIGIDPERFRKIVNRTNPTKKRDCIIACGFALCLKSGETSDALIMYDFPRLDDGLEREEYICELLDEQEEKQRSLAEINACLRTLGYSELDIIDHRKGRKAAKVSPKPSRYEMRGVHVECRLDEQVFGDQFNSLMTEFSPDRYRVVAKMGLTDLMTGQDFELIAEPAGILSRVDYPIIAPECIHTYNSLGETGDLRSLFESIQSYARQELAKRAKLLKNSRNYRDRISARVIDNSLHIFTETYNYGIPELQEYFLMDYADGKFSFTVSDKSRFMELYLSQQEYSKYYGLPSSRTILSFASEGEVKEAVDNEKDVAKRMVMKQRLQAYQRMHKLIIVFAKRLNKDVFIVNPDIIVDNDIDLFEYYGVTEETFIGLVDDDLYKGFILGLQSLAEIDAFKAKYGSLEIDLDLENRD